MEKLYEKVQTKYQLPFHLKKEQCEILHNDNPNPHQKPRV